MSCKLLFRTALLNCWLGASLNALLKERISSEAMLAQETPAERRITLSVLPARQRLDRVKRVHAPEIRRATAIQHIARWHFTKQPCV